MIFGGGEGYIVFDKGNMQIQSSGRNLIFLNVYYVPGMVLILLFVS